MPTRQENLALKNPQIIRPVDSRSKQYYNPFPVAKILIVDDDADCLELLSIHLKRRGHSVNSAKDGPEALEQAAGERPHAIILDLRLPGVDGGRVVQLLRDNTLTQATPVLLISAADRRWAAKRIPTTDPLIRFIEKPIDFEHLDKTLGELLASRP